MQGVAEHARRRGVVASRVGDIYFVVAGEIFILKKLTIFRPAHSTLRLSFHFSPLDVSFADLEA
jgi:hypothetical protein